jgi:uncharacterized spore protein YtfJ
MSAVDVLDKVRLSLSASTVIGEPVVADGLTVIPVTRIYGGGGGGGGQPAGPGSDAGGAGFGLTARPVGVFVLREGTVRWQPSIDVNRVILGGQVVAVVALLVLRTFLKSRPRRRR